MLLKINKNLHDFDNIRQLHLISSCLLVLVIFFENIIHHFSFGGSVIFIGSLFLFKTHYFSLKKLQYTYWSINFVVLIYVLINMVFVSSNNSVPLIGFLILKFIEMYLVSSPIYYPWFNWWEYDFRYRNDLKAYVTYGGKTQEARVTDIRRNAACVTLFESLPIGSTILVIMHEDKNTLNIEGRIISVRETTLGRGFTYGVSFNWDNDLAREYYWQMRKSWHQGRVDKKRDRFESTNTNIQ